MITYVLTFQTNVADDARRRADLNRFLKACLRQYNLRLKNIETKEENKRASSPKEPTGAGERTG